MVRKGDGFDVALAWMKARRYAETQEDAALETTVEKPKIKEAAVSKPDAKR